MVKVSLFTHVHSSPFSLGPGYTDVTVPIILIMAGHFLDRLYVCVCVYIYVCIYIDTLTYGFDVAYTRKRIIKDD